eukprot:TRINITY_DN1766_c0_g1::TRINITY_DN1766_c0_g1_i1::g.25131::m.25131 TRINITY_DN1766_c0_g1::TRINITY_DN1766_c0_g1_i1::g.25131  ORF type:complete len:471 (+),score=146.62,sp/Q99MB4/CBWD1_RAT/39.52/2e-70,cobW/PF02492.14/1.1e-42,CobW_C/PF07683.9/4.1e-19,AAA_19/PF13245.1/0.00063,Arch_ATPase/PF01637.13/0.002,AAA_18/PF13238.1/0.0052,AAA_18/PF13238.1/4.5e+03,T2SE/PF00437.15/0.0031,AAA_10/PF12846.2/0.011,MMR_HSR1/PF01926.18/0.015,AAA_14/PF13173.1/0.02,AAA_22/PF13401.1/0.016,MobB/PF03205.9/0.025,ArgK/PF03308.11
MASKKPVTVITGFLGSGKTTLLNYIKKNLTHGRRIAVIENEFAGKGIGVGNELNDSESSFAAVIETESGCLCCDARGDFIKAMKSLLAKSDMFDYIIIETTGMADPAFANTLFTDNELSKLVYLDGIITLVDAKHITPRLDEVKPGGAINEALEQIASADRVILNKCDLVSSSELDTLTTRIRGINGSASILRTKFSEVDLADVLDIKAFDITRMNTNFTNRGPGQHDLSIQSITLELKGALQLTDFEAWLRSIVSRKGDAIYRAKGVVAVAGHAERFVFQGVHSLVEIHAHTQWGDDESPMCRFVFIGKNLDAEEFSRDFENEFGLPLTIPQPPPPVIVPMETPMWFTMLYFLGSFFVAYVLQLGAGCLHDKVVDFFGVETLLGSILGHYLMRLMCVGGTLFTVGAASLLYYATNYVETHDVNCPCCGGDSQPKK